MEFEKPLNSKIRQLHPLAIEDWTNPPLQAMIQSGL